MIDDNGEVIDSYMYQKYQQNSFIRVLWNPVSDACSCCSQCKSGTVKYRI